MKRAVALAAALVLTPAAAALGQGHDLWVGSEDVHPTRIQAGTHVLETSVLENGERTPGYTQIEEVAFVNWNDRDLVRQVVVIERDGQVLVTDTTFYDAQTMAPVRHASHAPDHRDLSLAYWGDKVRGTVSQDGAEPEQIDVTLEQQVYDPSSYLLLVRALPLGEGYGVRIPILNHEKLTNSHMNVWVDGTEWVETGSDESTDAFVVSISYDGIDSRSKYWIAKDSRLLLKSEESWREGQTVTGWARFTASSAETDGGEGTP